MTEVLLPSMVIGLFLFFGARILMPSIQRTAVETMSGQYAAQAKQLRVATYGQNPLNTRYSITLEDGSNVAMLRFPASISKSIETIGVSGTTQEMLASFVALINQLVEDEKLTEAEGEQLKRLSNTGFTLAANQHTLEEAALLCGKNKDCLKQAISKDPAVEQAFINSMLVSNRSAEVYLENSVPLKPGDLEVLKALDPRATDMFLGDSYVSADPMNRVRVGKDLSTFLTQYRAIEANKTLSPVVQSLTAYLATNVFSLTHINAYQFSRAANYLSKADNENKISDIQQGSLKEVLPESQNTQTARQYSAIGLMMPAGMVIHKNSTTLCDLGKGEVQDHYAQGQCK